MILIFQYSDTSKWGWNNCDVRKRLCQMIRKRKKKNRIFEIKIGKTPNSFNSYKIDGSKATTKKYEKI